LKFDLTCKHGSVDAVIWENSCFLLGDPFWLKRTD